MLEVLAALAVGGVAWFADNRKRAKSSAGYDVEAAKAKAADRSGARAVQEQWGWHRFVEDGAGGGHCPRCGRRWDASAIRNEVPRKMPCPKAEGMEQVQGGTQQSTFEAFE